MGYITPIETHYNGYRFRSRLEARWAVFLDSIGFDYDYEPEGFKLGNGLFYLPDFYISTNNSWVEIKGREITDKDLEKMLAFCAEKCDVCKGGTKFRILQGRVPKAPAVDGVLIGIECYNYVSADEYNGCYKEEGEKDISEGVFVKGVWSPACSERDLIIGLNAARKARFEFGESGYYGR